MADSADLLALLHSGDEEAARAIFEQYAERLTRLARSRLSASLAARVDAEDIVQSAWRSFFTAARAGQFQVEHGGDLWRLLVEVTLHKLYRQAARHQAQLRSVRREQALGDSAAAAAVEPTPAEAAAAADELDAVMRQLPPRGRQALALRLEGYEHAEIAEQLGCHERTVRRDLAEARRVLTARAGGDFIPTAARRAPPRSLQPRREVSQELLALALLPWSDFVLREQIGAGASGRVYRALQRSTGQEVAVKFLRKSLRDNPAAVERFLREALTVSKLHHPGIVAVHGAGRTPGGGFFLLMDLVPGRDLESFARGETVEPRQAGAWVAEAARAVHAAHERGVIHCDLKPGNLLLDAGGRIRVTDFGLAMPLSSDRTDLLPAGGTPAFMAPEQADPRWGAISPRTDVYGLGAVLHFLLYSRPPYTAASAAEVLSQVASPEPVPVPAFSIDPRLREILVKALCKPPAQRFATGAELADALRGP